MTPSRFVASSSGLISSMKNHFSDRRIDPAGIEHHDHGGAVR
jgi:hypothetical protein